MGKKKAAAVEPTEATKPAKPRLAAMAHRQLVEAFRRGRELNRQIDQAIDEIATVLTPVLGERGANDWALDAIYARDLTVGEFLKKLGIEQ